MLLHEGEKQRFFEVMLCQNFAEDAFEKLPREGCHSRLKWAVTDRNTFAAVCKVLLRVEAPIRLRGIAGIGRSIRFCMQLWWTIELANLCERGTSYSVDSSGGSKD